jgi:hypothetical protein
MAGGLTACPSFFAPFTGLFSHLLYIVPSTPLRQGRSNSENDRAGKVWEEEIRSSSSMKRLTKHFYQ